MPQTVSTNNLTLCHQGTDGVAISSLPDTCLTPSPNGAIPIPYTNIAEAKNLIEGSQTVMADGMSIAIQNAKFSPSSGDEGGVAGGVASGTIMGEAAFTSFSPDVTVEGVPVGRLTDKMIMNTQNTGCLGGILISPVMVPPAAPIQAEETSSEEEEEEDLKWIKFKFLEDATEEPVGSFRLKITFPDGTEKKCYIFGCGTLHIIKLQEGDCTLEILSPLNLITTFEDLSAETFATEVEHEIRMVRMKNFFPSL